MQCFLVLNTTKYDIPQKLEIDFVIEMDEAVLPIDVAVPAPFTYLAATMP